MNLHWLISWDSIQITMFFVKSQIQKTFTSEIWKGMDYQSLIDCFVFDKDMHEIPCIQFMTMWKINKIAFFFGF